MKIRLIGRNGATPLVAAGPVTLQSQLVAAGFEFSSGDQANLVIVSDLNADAVKEVRRLKKQPNKTRKFCLIRNEPAVVCPENYNLKNLQLFDTVIDLGRVFPTTTKTFNWPQTWIRPKESDADIRTSRVVFMNANKLSLIKGELYSLRRQCLHMQQIDTYGPNWNSGFSWRLRKLLAEFFIALRSKEAINIRAIVYWFSQISNYKGTVKGKLETLARYKVALVIENSSDYMSEKLFDSLLAGCVPVYVGPPVESFNIPSNLVIQCESNIKSIQTGLTRALDLDYEAWSRNLNDFLNDPKVFAKWESTNVFQEIAAYLKSFAANES